ncbi:MAG: hypothetical protein H0T46_16915 [Deltaproteobacteria bacterium]|nr:hypothetical protein [Deltaproteobacteria bacterium]
MRWLYLTAMLVTSTGCPRDPPPACKTVETSCAPLYVGNFTEVYSRTISMKCGTADGSCHAASADSSLSFATEQGAYDSLLSKYVTPGDPNCSEFIVRTSSPGTDYQMPQGSPLGESEQCALRKWVDAGAPR